jgi:hypothetical protein
VSSAEGMVNEHLRYDEIISSNKKLSCAQRIKHYGMKAYEGVDV